MVGNFDGVHRGHVQLVTDAVADAHRAHLKPIVLTFEPHPASVIRGVPVPRLTSARRRCELLTRIDPVLEMAVEPFTAALAQLEPEEFFAGLLVESLRAREVVVGKNFRFGRGRSGGVDVLEELGKRFGVRARAVTLSGDEQGPFSSSRARAALASGGLDAFRDVVGRPHSVSGVVGEGRQLGRKLGWPTANLNEVPEALPPHGSYACLVEDVSPGEAPRRLGVAAVNVGVRPTVDGGSVKVEVHVLGFSGDLRGRELRVHFEQRLRGEERFTSVEHLRAAIGADVSRTATFLEAHRGRARDPGPWY